MNEMPVWTCTFSDGPAAKLDNLTVGAEFGLSCRGDIPVEWAAGEAVRTAFPKEEEVHTLDVLRAGKLEPQAAEFVVTAYKPGKHAPEYVRFVQGTKGFEVAKPVWDVKSVLKQGEQPQPYPPFGPFKLMVPLWILVAAALALIIVVYFTWRRIRRAGQRRRMLEELRRHRTALSPLHQFFRDARALRRRIHAAKEPGEYKPIAEALNREFRLYVLRQFEIPALDWSDSEIMTDLRRRHRRVFNKAGEPLKKALRELGRSRGEAQILLEDVEQLHGMSLDAAEKLAGAREAGK